MLINRVEKGLYYEIDKDFKVLLISNYSEKKVVNHNFTTGLYIPLKFNVKRF